MKRKAIVKRTAPGQLSKRQVGYLITGFDWPFLDFDGESFGSEDEARRAWVEHRDELMARKDWTTGASWTRCGPAERPHGWWTFEKHPVRREAEEEIDYLRRHGLLERGEEEAFERVHSPTGPVPIERELTAEEIAPDR